jgi:hypothetical protein
MQHPYSYKLIGNLSQSLLEELKIIAPEQEYFSVPDFHANVIKVSRSRRQLAENYQNIINKVYKELAKFFDPGGNIETNFACMYPNTYLVEHADYNAVNYGSMQDNIIKIQIPIITNDKVAAMWRNTEDNDLKSIVAQLVEGGIYIFNNVQIHSAINLSNQNRYYLTIRFKKDAVRDYLILE